MSYSTPESSGNYYAMNTVMVISVGANNAGITSDALGAIFTHYSDLADNTIRYDGVVNVYDLNQTNEPLVVDQDLFDLLQFSENMKTETSGYFNILIGGLSDLWKKDLFNLDSTGASLSSSSEIYTPIIPSQGEIDAELAKMNASSLVFDSKNRSVQRLGEGKIDLGGVAKGYATAKAQALLREGGVVNYWIDAGHSSVALGESNAADGSFNVHYNDLGSSVYTKIKDCAVGTSSYFEQHATVNGQLYSHIVNPLTGSALVNWYGASIVGPDAGILDVLSTTFVLMGPGEQSDALIAKYGLQALFYKNGVDTLVNKGMTLYHGS